MQVIPYFILEVRTTRNRQVGASTPISVAILSLFVPRSIRIKQRGVSVAF